MKEISMDLRQRIVDAYDKGDTTRQKVAERFGVSLAFVKKLLSRRKRFGTIASFQDRVGRKRAIPPEGQNALREHIEKHPGATLAELRSALGLACSLVTIFNTLRRMKLTYKKKTLRAAEQDCPEIQAQRKDWLAKCVEWIAEHLVFVDEAATTTKMIRLYGRALRGQRARDAAPHGHWGVRTLIGALFGAGRTACMTIDAATDNEIFYQFVVCILVPELRPGNIVVLDNLRSHKQQRVRDAIEAVGGRVEYLPPYSPDLNPIEKMWSKVKAILRKLAARTSEALDEAIRIALESVTPADAAGWLASCGYTIS